jgi:hypothetical protein
MRAPAAFAVLAWLALPARADVPGKPVGLSADVDGPQLRQCSAEDAKSIRLALGVAAGLADSCLKAGLAPDLGDKVLGLFGKKKLQIYCDGETDGNGNASTTFPGGRPTISVFSKSGGAANDMSPEGLGAALLHELIHATDPDKKLIATQTLHDKAYPDRVYGCHLACTGRGSNEGMKARLALLMHAAGKRLEPASSVKCSGGDCGFQKLMGALCGPQGEDWVAIERREEKRFEQTGCLLRAVAVEGKCKAEVCADIQRQVKEASAKGPPPATLVGALMIHLYDVVKASGSPKDREALPDRDAALLEAVEDGGVLKSCAGAGR